MVTVFTEGGSIKDTKLQSYSVYHSYFAILLIVHKNKSQWMFDFALSVVKSYYYYYYYYYYKYIFLYVLFSQW